MARGSIRNSAELHAERCAAHRLCRQILLRPTRRFSHDLPLYFGSEGTASTLRRRQSLFASLSRGT